MEYLAITVLKICLKDSLWQPANSRAAARNYWRDFTGRSGRSLDHIGFEVKDLAAFCKKREADGVTFDMPFRDVPRIGLKIAFVLDPAGTRIELTEGLAGR